MECSLYLARLCFWNLSVRSNRNLMVVNHHNNAIILLNLVKLRLCGSRSYCCRRHNSRMLRMGTANRKK